MGHKRNLDSVNGINQEEVEQQQQAETSSNAASNLKKKKLKPNGQINDDTTITANEIENNGDVDDNNNEQSKMVTKIPKTRKDLLELSYDQKLEFVSIIAKPMATKKLAKKLFKLMRKASKLSRKELLRIGLKEVQLRIRKGERGLIVFAGDVTPIEIMCHLPAICEEKNLPYIYVPFRTDISSAIGVRRPALMVLIKKHSDYEDLFNECETKINEFMVEFLKQN